MQLIKEYDNWYPFTDITRIKQKDSTGCGLACVAMIVGAAYQDIRAEYIKQIGKKPRSFGTTAQELLSLINAYDFIAEPFDGRYEWSNYEGVNIIGVFSSRPHWVVHIKLDGQNYFIDPDANLDFGYRCDFYRTKPLGDGLKILGPI